MRSTFPRSSVFVLGSSSVQSLVPSTIISQVEALLESHRIEEATNLAESQRKKLQGSISIDEADELRYVYQRIGFQCFTETRFGEAVNCFFNGDLDPRLVISYYPNLRGSMFTSDDSLDVFAGVAERMPTEGSVEDIVVTNLVRNYSPHISPNTRTAPPTAELRKILVADANEKLESFLTRWRERRKAQGGNSTAAGGSAKQVVDTVLVKLFAELEKTQELYNILLEPHDIVVSEVEPVLKRNGQYNALCMLYRESGDDGKLLDVWSKLVDGEWTDDHIPDPLSNMIGLLNEKRDRTLTQHWGLWLTKRDPERGLQLLMPKDTGKRRERPDDDVALLDAIKEANAEAGVQYLEYLVLQRKSSSRQLHDMFAVSCIEQLSAALAEESVSKLWRAKAASYASNRTDTSFLSYFASTTPDSPHKRTRLKTILFLAGSGLYDPAAVRPLLLEHQKILKLELVIVDGKLGHHREALSNLVHDLHDSTSAELYCTLGGDIVPPKAAQTLAENNAGLEGWATALYDAKLRNGAAVVGMTRQKSGVDEGKKTELLKVLLEVYMNDGGDNPQRAAHLINSQARNLDVLDVIPVVPPDWPLNLVSSFLARSFRRTIHARHEGMIVKAISSGQNLEVKDRTWLILREEGAIIEEPLEQDGDGRGEAAEPQSFDEKHGFINGEKIALHLTDIPTVNHEDVHVEKVEWGRERDGKPTHSGRNYDYTKIYSPDKEGDELKENARVWNVYLDEAENYDADMIQGFRNIMNGLLVFASLFSAIVTTFVAQTSQALQPDDGQIAISLLFEINQLLRAAGNLTSIRAVPVAALGPGSVTYTSTDVWVNGLFFTSLALSLSTALLTVLAKQWIQVYTTVVPGGGKTRAFIRQFRFQGFITWKIRDIIESLPLILHGSVAIFLVGLALYASKLSFAICGVVAAITGFTFLFYLGTSMLPALFITCPYRITPLFSLAQLVLFAFRLAMCAFLWLWCNCTGRVPKFKGWPALSRKSLKTAEHDEVFPDLSDRSPTSRGRFWSASRVACDCLHWVFNHSSNHSVKEAVIKAVCGLLDEWEDFSKKCSSASSFCPMPAQRDLFLSTMLYSLNQCSSMSSHTMEDEFHQSTWGKLIISIVKASSPSLSDGPLIYSRNDWQERIHSMLAKAYRTSIMKKDYGLSRCLLKWGQLEIITDGALPHFLAMRGDRKDICGLLDAGIDINHRDHDGWTALHRAAVFGNLDAVTVLVERERSLISVLTNSSQTALDVALEQGHSDVVAYLLDQGADRPPYALHGAARLQSQSMAKVLLDRGWDKTAKDNQGRTPIDIATNDWGYDSEMVMFLQQYERANDAGHSVDMGNSEMIGQHDSKGRSSNVKKELDDDISSQTVSLDNAPEPRIELVRDGDMGNSEIIVEKNDFEGRSGNADRELNGDPSSKAVLLNNTPRPGVELVRDGSPLTVYIVVPSHDPEKEGVTETLGTRWKEEERSPAPLGRPSGVR
ncbi:hypothetical protein C0995_003410 [Termitomyces sp. Mi166|nr:hypothetical protein C0995_003410 [Termitomyces sp. Mi166\